MIRINLLPSEERSSRRTISLPTISGGAVLWAGVAVAVYASAITGVSVLQGRTINDYNKKIEVAKEESARLAPQLAKIRKLTKEREEVNKRLNIIASLDRDRYQRVQMMNELSTRLPQNLWLTNVVESGGNRVSIEGVTFSNFIIADLMTDLEESDLFAEVSLKIAEEGEIEEYKVLKFTLNSRLVQ